MFFIRFGGIQLKRIIDAFGHGNVLELGTNTGLSGCYFLSSENTEHFYTIEGSPDLCKIADINLKKGYYIYSTHPEKSLSPSYVELEDSSYFDLIGILMEPDPKIKYDSNFDMEIGYHISQSFSLTY